MASPAKTDDEPNLNNDSITPLSLIIIPKCCARIIINVLAEAVDRAPVIDLSYLSELNSIREHQKSIAGDVIEQQIISGNLCPRKRTRSMDFHVGPFGDDKGASEISSIYYI